MNKATKIVVILMLTFITIYIMVGIYKSKKNEITNISSGDSLNSGDNNEVENKSELEITYEITSGENDVVLKGINENSISTTTYLFEDGKLKKITLSEEIISGDDELAENIYNYMKTNPEMSLVYSSVERNGKTINAVLREEYVDVYAESTKNEIYEELVESLELSE